MYHQRRYISAVHACFRLLDLEQPSVKQLPLHLPHSVFSHGHLYVGFSRCGDPEGTFVYADQSEFDNIRDLLEEGKTYTRNVVYPEMFR